MSPMSPVFELARVTIEFTTAFRVGSGGWDPLVDAFFATDANGLPAIPGTSIAGVLRHAAEDAWGNAEVRQLFGYQAADEGASSRLQVSWGHVHDQRNRPVPFRGATMDNDGVLASLAAGVVRDHVRMNARGTVDGTGKFDEHLVPAGARFTFEMCLQAGESTKALPDVLALLTSPTIRLGAGARNGLGRFKVSAARYKSFNLADPSDRVLFGKLPTALDQRVPDGILHDAPQIPPLKSPRWRSGVLTLKPEDYWMIGGGDPWRAEEHTRTRHDKTTWVDNVPVEMRSIVWTNGEGSVGDPAPVVPGSSVKGALRHRVAFHARRHRRQFCDPSADLHDHPPPEVAEIFGELKGQSEEDGVPGRLLIADAVPKEHHWGRLDHVSLDRFTQGALDRALYSETPLYQGEVVLEVALDMGLGKTAISTLALDALQAAFEDLCNGTLAIGAGANRGHGYCAGEWAGGEAPWT